jgi:MFS family permease
MGTGVLLMLACIAVALSGLEQSHFAAAMLLLGVGWNFVFTSSTTLSLTTFTPVERDRAQGALNFSVFVAQAIASFASGVLVTTRGWQSLNIGSIAPVVLIGLTLLWLRRPRAPAAG